MKNAIRPLLALMVLALALPTPASATVTRVGALSATIVGNVRGSDVAYDSLDHVYLVVASQGVLQGRFVNASGTVIGSSFVIQSTGIYTHYPRVAFSPDADGGNGAFLVTWHESDLAGGNTSVHARMVSFKKGGVIGAENVLSREGSSWEYGAAIAYSSGSQEFLVAYALVGPGMGVRAVRVDNNAVARAAAFTIKGAGQYAHYPSVAYNPVTNQFLVAYSGYDPSVNGGWAEAVLVQAGTNQFASGQVRLVNNAGTWITGAAYNSRKNQFFVAWFSLAPIRQTLGRVIGADGSLIGGIVLVSTRWAGTDGLGIAYNAISNSMFVASNDSFSVQTGGVELNGDGIPVDAGGFVTTTGSQTQFAKVAASTDDPNWLVSLANNYSVTMTQLMAGTADATAPAPAAPAPNTPQPRPIVSVDTPSNNATVSVNGFAIAGWAADTGASAGTGVDAVVAWAWPTSGAPAILAGVAAYGNARPDVAAALGNAQFTNTGFGLTATLPAGTYTLSVHLHSTVTGTWATPAILRITVQAPASKPLMWVDTPTQNQTVSSSAVHIGGWAVDLASPGGTGVDAIHVWAYPARNPTQPIFLGAAVLGTQRPDVAAFLGSTRFTPAGFDLVTTLAPDNYKVVVFAHSTVTGTFNNAKVIIINVQ